MKILREYMGTTKELVWNSWNTWLAIYYEYGKNDYKAILNRGFLRTLKVINVERTITKQSSVVASLRTLRVVDMEGTITKRSQSRLPKISRSDRYGRNEYQVRPLAVVLERDISFPCFIDHYFITVHTVLYPLEPQNKLEAVS
jgi:hypothetical protein